MSDVPLTPPLLHYTTQPRRRRRSILISIAVLGLFFALFAARKPAHALLQRFELLRALDTCAAYQLPPGQLIYEEGPYDSSIKLPELYSKPILIPSPPVWDDVRARTVGPNRYPEATLFLHRLRTPGGLERIVHVGRSWQGYEMQPLVLRYVLIHPAGLRSPINTDAGTATVLQETEKREYLDARGVYPFIIQPGLSNLRFFAGHPDPADAACLIIPFELDGQRLEVIGRLTEYGSLLFTVPGPEEESTGE